MPWARFEDRFPSNRKIRKLDDTSFRLYVSAICWSAENLTDGVVEADDLRLVAGDLRSDADPHAVAANLVRLGLWDTQNDGWVIHDYHEYNPTAEQVKAERALKNARQQRWRKGARASNGIFAVDASTDASQDALLTRLETPPRPDPTRPVLATQVTTPAPAAPDADASKPKAPSRPRRPTIEAPDEWAKFWAAYPRKKDKGSAEKAWNAAVRAGADPNTILDGVLFYRLDCANKEAQYIKYPATWLNARGWQDEPDPQPQVPKAIGAPSEAAAVQPLPYREVMARHERIVGDGFDFGDAFGMPA